MDRQTHLISDKKRPPYAGGLSSEWESAGLAFQQCATYMDVGSAGFAGAKTCLFSHATAKDGGR